MATFYAVSGLSFDEGFVYDVRLVRIALLLLKIELRLPCSIIDPGCHVMVSVDTLD